MANLFAILAQVTTDADKSVQPLADSLSPQAKATLIFMIAILGGGLTWSIYRALTAKPVPDEEQFSGDV